MNRIFLLILISIFTVSIASAQTTFLKKLKKGEKQTVVFSEKPNINKSGLRLNTESLKFSVAQKEPIPDFEQL